MFAPPYVQLSSLLPNLTTTIWNQAEPTDIDDKYGNIAWSSQWSSFNVIPPTITTTVTPTSIPSSELIKPPQAGVFFDTQDTEQYRFPLNFQWGFAGAALQIEGAVKSAGRGPSVTELELLALEQVVERGGPPDVTNLNYYLYKQDIARLAAVGVQSCSFSISWSRILPFAVPGSPVNKEAIDHYDDLINTVLDYGMIPIVTLRHFDTPLYYLTNTSSQGFDHPEFVEGFTNHARTVLHFSDRVGTWITFNEPTTDASRAGNYISAHNILMAHASAVHYYREQIGGTANWSIKLSFGSAGFPIPMDPANPDDILAVERHLEFSIGYLANPLFLGQPVPVSVSETLGSRSPNFTEDELASTNGTADFCAIDWYTSTYHTQLPEGLSACVYNSSHPSYPYCDAWTDIRDGWSIPYYQHARTVFRYITSHYPTHGGLMISEFGKAPFEAAAMTPNQEKNDLAQTLYYIPILNEILKSIHEDAVPLIGALGWSYVDNWKWGQYHDHYGVQGFN